jgi:plastocyanin
MTRIAVSALMLALVGVLAASAAARTGMAHPKLVGVVGKNDAFKISLKTSSGKVAKTIKTGSYTFVIHDDSTLHNYELDGPHGKSWTFTSVQFTGTKTRTITLKAGKYKAYCAPHEVQMFQHFTVK